jgi:hypothetical protein
MLNVVSGDTDSNEHVALANLNYVRFHKYKKTATLLNPEH